MEDLLGKSVGDELAKLIGLTANTIGNGWSVGKVMDNNDPDRMMRCKVFIYGVYPKQMLEDVAELPWIMPLDSGDYKGGACIPNVGELVNIEFEDGDINYPRFTTKAYNLQAIPSSIRGEGYPNIVTLFESGGYKGTLNRSTGELTIGLASSVSIKVAKDGAITIDNHLSVTGNDIVKLISPPSAETVAQEVNAEVQNKLAFGAPIRVRTSGAVVLEAPEIELGGGLSQVGSVVVPDPNPLGGGGFNCLTFCPFSGIPHQGRVLKSFYSSAMNSLEQSVN